MNYKHGLSPIAPYYFSSTLLTNCHTYRGSKTSLSFECAPPGICEYFQFTLTQQEEEAMSMYLDTFMDEPKE